MIKKTFAAFSIAYAVWIWFLAASSTSARNDDWAPAATIFFGLLGGIILLSIAIVLTIIVLKERRSVEQCAAGAEQPVGAMILLLNAGWIATGLAVLKVAVMN